jgi:hypothetical protein
VLLGQQGGGDQDRHLAVVFHCLERSAHGDLGLPVPDVTADQTVHRLAGFHVALDVLDGAELVRRLFVLEGCFELVRQRAVRPVPGSMDDLSVGIEVHQFLRHFFDALFDAGRGASPTGPAQPVHPGDLALRSPIVLDLIQPVERHVEFVAAGKL